MLARVPEGTARVGGPKLKYLAIPALLAHLARIAHRHAK
jgi:hypothetical protein